MDIVSSCPQICISLPLYLCSSRKLITEFSLYIGRDLTYKLIIGQSTNNCLWMAHKPCLKLRDHHEEEGKILRARSQERTE